MKRKEIEKMFIKANPKVSDKDLLWRADGRLEWLCSHKSGHTVYASKYNDFVHGCDGCCKKIIIPEKFIELYEKERNECIECGETVEKKLIKNYGLPTLCMNCRRKEGFEWDINV